MKKKAKTKTAKNQTMKNRGIFFRLYFDMVSYFTMRAQKVFIFSLLFALGVLFGVFGVLHVIRYQSKEVLSLQVQKQSYWFLLWRKSNVELLYRGISGDASKSELVKVFTVKTGIPGEKPTPLPKLLGKGYWTQGLDLVF